MEKDTQPTDIIFRKFKDNQIIALMPHEVADHKGNITAYLHLGQHTAMDYHSVVQDTKLATEAEYTPLKQELEGIGYLVNPIKKQNYQKYLTSYKNR